MRFFPPEGARQFHARAQAGALTCAFHLSTAAVDLTGAVVSVWGEATERKCGLVPVRRVGPPGADPSGLCAPADVVGAFSTATAAVAGAEKTATSAVAEAAKTAAAAVTNVAKDAGEKVEDVGKKIGGIFGG